MKKLAKQFLALMFVLILALGVFPQKAEAAYYLQTKEYALGKNTTVSANKYTREYPNSYDKYYYYKFTVKNTGYVKFSVSNANASLRIYKSYKKNAIPSGNYVVSLTGMKTYYRVLPKGTYYLYYIGYNVPDIKVSYSFTKGKLTTNYSKNRAISLKAKATATIFEPYGDEFGKWYKFKATSNKVTITTKVLDSNYSGVNFELRDSTGKSIDVSKYDSKNTVTDNGNVRKLTRKGMVKGATYYILISPYSSSYTDKYTDRRLITLSWQ